MGLAIKEPSPALRFTRPLTPRRFTDGVVIHHYAHATATPQDVHRWHLEREGGTWGGFGYNFAVDRDGTIWRGRGLEAQGVHTVGHNHNTVGVAFQGNYDMLRTMPDAQFDAGVWLLREIRKEYGEIPIYGHGELRPTACPGRFFPMAEMQGLKYRVFEEDEMRYNSIQEIAKEMTWAVPTIQKLIDRGILAGDGKGLDLSRDMVRLLVLNDRAGVYS